MANKIPFELPAAVDLLHLPEQQIKRRHLRDLAGLFLDSEAEGSLQTTDPCIYASSDLSFPVTDGDIAFGISTVFPGQIGEEYYMTFGHAHAVQNTAEVYFGFEGSGLILMEAIHGNEWAAMPLTPGQAVYVPKGFYHRSINTGDAPFVFFFSYRSDAGHDYDSIRKRGFRHRVLQRNGRPCVVEATSFSKNGREVPK